MTPTLRPYQIEAIERIEALIAQGCRRILGVAPCGAGKTVIAADLLHRVEERGQRALFLAAQRELIDQTSAKLDAVDVAHGIIMAGHEPRHSSVQVASVQTLVRRPTLPPADIVFIDEADLARADSYAKILEHYPQATVLGLTGTPWRSDGKGLGELFREVVVVATPRELIQRKFLVDFGGARFEPLDTSGIKTTAGDWDQKDLGDRATKSDQGRRLIGNVVSEYLARTPGKRAACFAVNIEHSKLLAEQFVAAGVAAEHIDGAMPKDQRAGIFARVRSGETRVLCNYGIVTRGVDVPALEVAILARPTKSLSLYIQMVGRVMRPSPETGKEKATIHDHAGLTAMHGFPDEDRDYSLTADPKKKREGIVVVGVRRCPECFSEVESGLGSCPACGFEFERKRDLVTVDGKAIDFAELRAKVMETQEREAVELRDLLWTSRNASVACFRFERTYGRKPSKELVAVARRLAGPLYAKEAA